MTPSTKKFLVIVRRYEDPEAGEMALALYHHHCLMLLKICQQYLLLFTDITLYHCCMTLLTVGTLRICWHPSLPTIIICTCKLTINHLYFILPLLCITTVRWCCCLMFTIADFHCLSSYFPDVVSCCQLMILTAIHQCRRGGIRQEKGRRSDYANN